MGVEPPARRIRAGGRCKRVPHRTYAGDHAGTGRRIRTSAGASPPADGRFEVEGARRHSTGYRGRLISLLVDCPGPIEFVMSWVVVVEKRGTQKRCMSRKIPI